VSLLAFCLGFLIDIGFYFFLLGYSLRDFAAHCDGVNPLDVRHCTLLFILDCYYFVWLLLICLFYDLMWCHLLSLLYAHFVMHTWRDSHLRPILFSLGVQHKDLLAWAPLLSRLIPKVLSIDHWYHLHHNPILHPGLHHNHLPPPSLHLNHLLLPFFLHIFLRLISSLHFFHPITLFLFCPIQPCWGQLSLDHLLPNPG
jgi:hypothetical protein